MEISSWNIPASRNRGNT